MSNSVGDRKRVAFLISSLRIGGAEKMAVQAADILSKRGYIVDVIVLSQEGEISLPKQCNLSLRVLPFKRTAVAPIGLGMLIWRYRYSHIICNFWILSAAACLTSVFFKNTKIILWEHGYEQQESVLFSLIKPFLKWRLDAILVVSERMKRYAQSRYKEKVQTFVIYNPLPNLASVPPVDHCIARAMPSVPTVACVSRLVSGKGLETLFLSWSIVIKKISARLVVVGDGPLLEELQGRARALGISNQLSFLGYHPEPIEIIRECQLVVLPSQSEGFGLPVLEALICGVPVVATRCGSIMEELEHCQDYGQIVPVDDHSALADAIMEYLREPKKVQFQELDKFSVDSYFNRLNAILE